MGRFGNLSDVEADAVMANLGCMKCYLFKAGQAWGKIMEVIPAEDQDCMQTAIKLAREVVEDVITIVKLERAGLTDQ